MEKLQKEDENRKYRQMILNEIDPILDELAKAEDDAILNKNSIGPKSCFFLTTEEVNK